MKKILINIKAIEVPPRFVPLALFFATIITYGLFFKQLGFYWDDLPISWIRYQLGIDAMRLYFSTSRPVWGELYRVTTQILPQVPMDWQLFALFWRWLGVVVLWGIFRILWPDRSQLVLVASFLFLLYPGFNQQWVSFLISHFYIVLFFFLFSQLLMLWSFLHPKRYYPLTLVAMLFSALNLWMFEYFFSLELIRPFFIFFFLVNYSVSNSSRTFGQTIIDTFKKWLPYLVVFIANTLYRMFVFTNLAYQNVLLTDLRTNPLGTSFKLFKEIVSDLWIISIGAWAQVFHFPSLSTDGLRITILYVVVALFVGSLITFFHESREKTNLRSAWWAIGLGILAMVAGGGPYWLAKLDITLGFPANRFTISFMLGVSLLIAGLLEIFPSRIRLVIAALLITLAAGRQFLWSNDFRRDWNAEKNMFWQMTWRAPGLEPGTILLMNEVLDFSADNSIGAALNWIYAPDNHTDRVDYVLFYPTNRLGGALASLEPGEPVKYTYLAGQFEGNTSQVVTFYFAPPGCLRLLDPEIDTYNRLIPDETLLRDAAHLSSTLPVLNQPIARMPGIYAPEPAHNWCYYFEQADLARQMGDWEKVAELGDIAFKLDDYPNDPLERFVFVEGYAHIGQWQKAFEYAQVSFKVSKNYVGPLLCRLWERIDREVPASPEKDEAVIQAKTLFGCNP